MDDGYLKLDNTPEVFMPVVVEQTGDITGFEAVYSVGHYGEQNGDLMADPEMTFGLKEYRFYPLSFRNDYVGVVQEVLGREAKLSQQGHLADQMISLQLTSRFSLILVSAAIAA